jgi:hypothetical protein
MKTYATFLFSNQAGGSNSFYFPMVFNLPFRVSGCNHMAFWLLSFRLSERFVSELTSEGKINRNLSTSTHMTASPRG